MDKSGGYCPTIDPHVQGCALKKGAGGMTLVKQVQLEADAFIWRSVVLSARTSIHIICLFLLAVSGHAAWSVNPQVHNVVSDELSMKWNLKMVPDGSGGAIFAWEDERNGNKDIFAQRLDASGVPLWPEGGLPVCVAQKRQYNFQIVGDGVGGCCIVWEDFRDTDTTDVNIYAQRLDAQGHNVWLTNGLGICTNTDMQTFPTIVSDGAGGFLIFWTNTSIVLQQGYIETLYGQHIRPDGSMLWPESGLLLGEEDFESNYINAVAESDGNGGAFLAIKKLSSVTGEPDIYGQRIGPSGTAQWTTAGIPICLAIHEQSEPMVRKDGTGGAIISWRDGRYGNADPSVYAQRVDGNGNTLWLTNGASVSAVTPFPMAERAMFLSDGNGGAMFAWADSRIYSDRNIYAGHLGAGGASIWDPDDMPICMAALHQGNVNMVTDGSDGGIVTWVTVAGDDTSTGICGQRVSFAGSIKWLSGGVQLTASQEMPMEVKAVPDGAGGAVIGWVEYYPQNPSCSIFATHVTGEGPELQLVQSDNFTTNVRAATPADAGWYYNENGTTGTTADATGGALRIGMPNRPDAAHYHVTSWATNLSDWIPYAYVGSNHVVRAKNYVYAGGQSPNSVNCIPNFRLKLQNASAVASTLEVLAAGNSAVEDSRGAELAPSRDMVKPSLYRVDYDPVDVPYLTSNAASMGYGGIMRVFESYAFSPQMNGNLFLAESQAVVYPSLLIDDNHAITSQPYYTKSYVAADLQNFDNSSDAFKRLRITGTGGGVLGSVYTTPPLPSIVVNASGVTLSSVGFPSTALAICEANFSPVSKPGANWLAADYAQVPRVEENCQYKIRFHIVSTQQSNRQAQIRCRARSNRFLWAQKLEIGGAFPTNSVINTTIAAQTLPGVGCLNPDPGALPVGGGGGWYTMIFNSPLNRDIRADVEGDLATRMPYLASQPGPGDTTIGNTRRMIFVGIDLVDTFSGGSNASLEAGHFTLDQIDIKTYRLVPD